MSDDKSENLFKIIDGIIAELNKTKKMFIIMILSLMIIPPITFVIINAVLDSPFPGMRGWQTPGHAGFWGVVRSLPFIIAVVWLAIGIRQWFILSKWTKKYDKYKKLQKEIDDKLDEDAGKDQDKSD